MNNQINHEISIVGKKLLITGKYVKPFIIAGIILFLGYLALNVFAIYGAIKDLMDDTTGMLLSILIISTLFAKHYMEDKEFITKFDQVLWKTLSGVGLYWAIYHSTWETYLIVPLAIGFVISLILKGNITKYEGKLGRNG